MTRMAKMGEVITLVPRHRYSMVVEDVPNGYQCYWYMNDTIIWDYLAEDLDGVATFFDNMIRRAYDSGAPIQGA